MDSTLRSNLSVGFPLDLVVYRKDELNIVLEKRIEEEDPHFRQLSGRWSQALRTAYQDMPTPDWIDKP